MPLPTLGTIGSIGGRAGSRLQPASPEEESNLFKRVGNVGLSGLASVGNLFDLPASSVRDVLGGSNPLDQWLPWNWFSADNRMTGRDVLTKWGVTQKNKTGGISDWWDDPMEAVRDIGSFAFEVGTDPLVFLPKVAKFLPKGGALQRAAERPLQAGLKAAAFNPASRWVGRKVVANPIGRAAADLGERDRLFGNQLLNYRVKQKPTRGLQKLAEKMTDIAGTADQEGREFWFPLAAKLERMGLTTPEALREQRMMREHVIPPKGTKEFRQAMAEAEARSKIERLTRAQHGLDSSLLQDEAGIVHGARGIGTDVQHAFAGRAERGGKRSRWASKGPENVARQQVYKGHKGGTVGENELVTDPNFETLVQAMVHGDEDAIKLVKANPDLKNAVTVSVGLDKNNAPIELDTWLKKTRRIPEREKGARRAAADYIRRKYGEKIIPTYIARDDAGNMVFREVIENRVGGRMIEKLGRKAHITPERIVKYGEKLPNGDYMYRPPGAFGVGEGEELLLRPITRDRYMELAGKIIRNPEFRKHGIYTNPWVYDEMQQDIRSRTQRGYSDATLEYLAQPEVSRHPLEEGVKSIRDISHRPWTVRQVAKKLGIGGAHAAERIAELRGIEIPAKSANAAARKRAITDILDMVVREEDAKGITSMWPQWKAPEEVGKLGKLFDSATNIWKMGMLAHPARHVRDITSGTLWNVILKQFGIRDPGQAKTLLSGGTVQGLKKFAEIKEWLRRTHRPVNDKNAADAMREIYAVRRGTPVIQGTQTIGGSVLPSGDMEAMLGQIPGHGPKMTLKRAARTLVGAEEGTTRNPVDLAGVMRKSGEVRDVTGFGGAVLSNAANRWTDDMNRLQPLLNRMRRGERSIDAMPEIMRQQVNYNPGTFTPFEQKYLRRAFPFYSFGSRMGVNVAKELWNNPGGRLSQVLRAEREMADPTKPQPQYVSQTGSIPITTLPDGTKRYLSGLGLMHEDPLSFFGGGYTGALTELGSRLNPMLKYPIEAMTGESLFQRGPMGGRDIANMDPILGRLLTNVGLRDETPTGRARPVINEEFEHILANSPISRLLSTARTLTDPRKRIGKTPLPGISLVNSLSGLRFSDISPAAQDAMMRDSSSAIASDLGAKSFTATYFPQETIEKVKLTDPQLADRMEAFNELRNLLSRKAKARKRAKAR